MMPMAKMGIPLMWSDSGPAGEDNAFGEIVSDRPGEAPLPIICGHGGSMWLCRTCMARIEKGEHVRPATISEYKRLKAGKRL